MESHKGVKMFGFFCSLIQSATKNLKLFAIFGLQRQLELCMFLQVVKRAYLQEFSNSEIVIQREATNLCKQEFRTLSFFMQWAEIINSLGLIYINW